MTRDPQKPDSLATMASLEEVYSDETVLVQRSQNTHHNSNRVLLCFTGIQHNFGIGKGLRPEFLSTAGMYDEVYFISDLRRSWGNNLNFSEFIPRLTQWINGRETHSLGNSMGGFLAILITQFIPITAVLTFSAQYSVDPDIIPEETRWMKFRSKISDFRYPSLDSSFQQQTHYTSIFGAAETELHHYRLFPKATNILSVAIEGDDHECVKTLKDRGVLRSVIETALSNDVSLNTIQNAINAPLTVLSAGQRTNLS